MTLADPAPNHRTKKQPSYNSEAEHSIADMLNTYGIPFYYKQPTLVVDNGHRCIEYADFFLPTYAGLSLDYCADPCGQAYKRKTHIYSENQVPAVLLTKQDISQQSWQRRLYNRLERTYHRNPTYRVRGRYR